MAKNKFSIQIDLEGMIRSLDRAGADLKKSIDAVEKASKKHVTDTLVRDTVPANYPAKGKYSTGTLASSIDTNYDVKWVGYMAEIKVGYDFKKAGVESIMLLYGTPRMKKATKLYNDIYGSKTKKQIAEIQQDALNKIIERAVSH